MLRYLWLKLKEHVSLTFVLAFPSYALGNETFRFEFKIRPLLHLYANVLSYIENRLTISILFYIFQFYQALCDQAASHSFFVVGQHTSPYNSKHFASKRRPAGFFCSAKKCSGSWEHAICSFKCFAQSRAVRHRAAEPPIGSNHCSA